ncbi:MAG: LptF/LptG family permease [Muribaculaceae bacterium]|nr:LptF/LptG family permease [Muribaculaceae bacterium]
MFEFKRLDRFILKTFLPLFAMTFLICTFLVLMQFLWMHLTDMVGKGLGMGLLLELFFYAALSMVPLALPLAVLLASLMTFGNLGESLELTAMKSGGVSLFRVMRPLIILMVFVSIGAFFFQNDVLPVAQSRMWTLLKSMRQKSPELDIAEGEFNGQLPNINIYVEKKNHDTGVLYDVMIYDLQQGFERSRVILCDSATLQTTPDKEHLKLTLYQGELFENLRDATGVNTTARNQLYRREEFHTKTLLIAFDANFERMDEGDMRSLYIGKNVSQLRHSIDSIHNRIDSIGAAYGKEIASNSFISLSPEAIPESMRAVDAVTVMKMNPDSMRREELRSSRRRYIQNAKNEMERSKMEYLGRSLYMGDEQKVLARHGIELHKKFTLSLACLVFFFIGAPLGAIIRKGGLGTPLVISVFLFIFYYIIDNSGMKMARDGKLPVWEGMWLSSAVLLPLGIWVTYKAVKDSAMFNADAWQRALRVLTGKNKRALGVKEVIIEDVDPVVAAEKLDELGTLAAEFLKKYPRPQGYVSYWRGGIDPTLLRQLTASLEVTVSYLSNTRSRQLMERLNEVPILQDLMILHPRRQSFWAKSAMYLLPVGLIIWAIGMLFEARTIKSVKQLQKILPQIQSYGTDETPPRLD